MATLKQRLHLPPVKGLSPLLNSARFSCCSAGDSIECFSSRRLKRVRMWVAQGLYYNGAGKAPMGSCSDSATLIHRRSKLVDSGDASRR